MRDGDNRWPAAPPETEAGDQQDPLELRLLCTLYESGEKGLLETRVRLRAPSGAEVGEFGSISDVPLVTTDPGTKVEFRVLPEHLEVWYRLRRHKGEADVGNAPSMAVGIEKPEKAAVRIVCDEGMPPADRHVIAPAMRIRDEEHAGILAPLVAYLNDLWLSEAEAKGHPAQVALRLLQKRAERIRELVERVQRAEHDEKVLLAEVERLAERERAWQAAFAEGGLADDPQPADLVAKLAALRAPVSMGEQHGAAVASVEVALEVAVAVLIQHRYGNTAQALKSGRMSAEDILVRLGFSERGSEWEAPNEPIFGTLVRLYQARRRQAACTNCGSDVGVPCQPTCPKPRG